jgi:dTDP-4-dehydrorhamnose reductase
LKKILIVGASGFLGSYCFKELKKMPNVEVIGTKHKSNNQFLNKIDYTNHKEFIQFLEVISPDILVWCGGLKNLSITEKNLNLALNQNFKPIKTIVSYQKTKKTLRLIFTSSDYVFSGEIGDYKVSDIPKPETNYGISKLKAENHIKNHSTNFSIIRAGAIMGKDSSFFKMDSK